MRDPNVADADEAFMLSRKRDFTCIKTALEDAIEMIECRMYSCNCTRPPSHWRLQDRYRQVLQRSSKNRSRRSSADP
jgi:hypothetical protein